MRGEKSSSLVVVFHLLLVDRSVNFDDQMARSAEKIDEVWPDWLLATKVVTIQPMRPEKRAGRRAGVMANTGGEAE